jgi:hypothetical protein
MTYERGWKDYIKTGNETPKYLFSSLMHFFPLFFRSLFLANKSLTRCLCAASHNERTILGRLTFNG